MSCSLLQSLYTGIYMQAPIYRILHALAHTRVCMGFQRPVLRVVPSCSSPHFLWCRAWFVIALLPLLHPYQHLLQLSSAHTCTFSYSPWWHCLERTSTKIPNEFIQADGVIPVNIHGIEDAPKLKYLQTRGQGRPPAGQFQCVHSPRVRQSASSANIQYS